MTIAKPTPPAAITPGTAPIRGTSTFYQDAQLWAEQEGTVVVPGVNAHTAYMGSVADYCEQEANVAEAAAAVAVAAEAAATAIAGATQWVPGNYNAGDEVFSPMSWLTYRARTTGSKATDPSQDGANWRCLNGRSAYQPKTANYTLQAGDAIAADPSGGSFALAFPPNPNDQEEVDVLDLKGVFSASTKVTMTRIGGRKVMGKAEDFELITPNRSWTWRYFALTDDWRSI